MLAVEGKIAWRPCFKEKKKLGWSAAKRFTIGHDRKGKMIHIPCGPRRSPDSPRRAKKVLIFLDDKLRARQREESDAGLRNCTKKQGYS